MFHKRKKKRRKEAEKKQEEAVRKKRIELRKKVSYFSINFLLVVLFFWLE